MIFRGNSVRRLAKSLARACAATLAIALFASGAQAIEVTQNLVAEGAIAAQQSKPLLLFFTQPGCSFCERARAEYLRHLALDPAYTARAIFREVSIGKSVTGFDGQRRSGAAVGRAQGVTLYPTIVIVDASGKPLAPPLRGYTVPDFYGASIDSRLDDAHAALQAISGSAK